MKSVCVEDTENEANFSCDISAMDIDPLFVNSIHLSQERYSEQVLGKDIPGFNDNSAETESGLLPVPDDSYLSDSLSIPDGTSLLCQDVNTPDVSDVSGNFTMTTDCSFNQSHGDNSILELLKNAGYDNDDIDAAVLAQNSIVEKESEYGRDRPTTHVFCQGKSFTYPKLEVPKGKNQKKVGHKNWSRANLTVPVLNPEVSLFVPENSTSHHSLTLLKSLRIENVNNVIFGQLNINSIRNKFHGLKEIIQGNVDELTITETKLDSTSPNSQFYIPGYKTPYRRDIE